MISSTATVFLRHPEKTVPGLAHRLSSRFESIRTPDGRVVLHLPSVGTVLMRQLESALSLHYVVQDAAQDFAARTALEALLRRDLRRRVYTIGWLDREPVSVPRW
jgi:hypothetical protein